jgi:hypothetical protein
LFGFSEIKKNRNRNRERPKKSREEGRRRGLLHLEPIRRDNIRQREQLFVDRYYVWRDVEAACIADNGYRKNYMRKRKKGKG